MVIFPDNYILKFCKLKRKLLLKIFLVIIGYFFQGFQEPIYFVFTIFVNHLIKTVTIRVQETAFFYFHITDFYPPVNLDQYKNYFNSAFMFLINLIFNRIYLYRTLNIGTDFARQGLINTEIYRPFFNIKLI